jgi:NADH:quinone reductase (non-electrogenic)
VPTVVVVGGGSTGTELAAEISTTDWRKAVGRPVRRPRVRLVTGAVPLLEGFPARMVRHARQLLGKAGVELVEGRNATRVDAASLTLKGGDTEPFDLCVWCAGVQAPEMVRKLPGRHGHGGRLLVDEHLELPGHPGVFAVGDVAEVTDPKTGLLVPSTAQAALIEAPFAGANLVARARSEPLIPFEYHSRGVIVSVGRRRAVATIKRFTLWGTPAGFLQWLAEKEYSASARHPP